ncbi:Alpha-galactosidase A [Pontiella desulfatans]|uniref:Alpha-galactosidase n=2 Tax=Pontiella desulfatans TaxID=2750659 RepID=A0A6C2TXQ8_PONDE|nr:Alpha-galactosidase A [Pontiella desulfatans]
MHRTLSLLVGSCLLASLLQATDAAGGETPPMGWNSYNKFGLGVHGFLVRETVDGAKRYKLDEAGYKYIVMDDGWPERELAADGRLVPDPNRFPEGIKPLTDYVKSQGFELGIYSSPNKRTCGDWPGSLGNEELHAQQFAEWGVKFVKYDYCPTRNDEQETGREEIIRRYRVFTEALNKVDPEMVHAICEKGWAGSLSRRQRKATNGTVTAEQRHAAFAWAPELGTMWRTTGDIKANWKRIMQILDMQEGLEELAGPGAFNNPDMLEVGNGNLTRAENRAHFSLWCILNSPLILGNDLRNIPDDVVEIITNKEVIALNQDVLCKQGKIGYSRDGVQVWVKPLKNGDTGVLILNRNDEPVDFTFNFADASLEVNAYIVRDLWAKKTLGTINQSLKLEIASHDVKVYRLGIP